jgi:Nif-specific regulatory protein
VGAAVASGRSVNVPDTARDSRFYSGIDEQLGFATRNLLALPLRNHAGVVIGAFEVLNHPTGFGPADEQLLEAFAGQAAIAIENAQLVGELASENERLRHEVESHFSLRSILGTSPAVQKLVRTIEQIRDTSVDVLVTGESGTGKELIARAIHHTSPRAAGPWVALNCAALPDALLESELFGIEKGVATGVERKIGKFEQADGGTLFLDEIGDLSPAAQAKILRAIQERSVERVGGRDPIAVDVRIVAATNKDLAAEVKKGAFRADLFYRLEVIHLRTVPLRQIPEDVPLLAQHFLTQFCRETGRPRRVLADDALRALAAHDWPGNVRELRNEMQRVAVLAPGRSVSAEDLSETVRGAVAGGDISPADSAGLHARVEAVEREMISAALAASAGNQQRAARELGLSRQGLIKKMKRYGLHPTAGP